MTNFVHLTNKTEYSLSEGAITINRIAELCESFRMPAVGITDTNNMFGALEFSDKISSYGVQPLIGCNIKINIPTEYKLDLSQKTLKDKAIEWSLLRGSYSGREAINLVRFLLAKEN